MTGRVFVDTNVLVYARDESAGEKQQRAARWLELLWRRRDGRLSYQVLNQFYVTVTQKLSPGMEAGAAWADVQAFYAWKPRAIDRPVLELAFHLVMHLSLSWWDSLILAAARLEECSYLLSEDLQAGLEFDGTRVVDPFDVEPEGYLTAPGQPV